MADLRKNELKPWETLIKDNKFFWMMPYCNVTTDEVLDLAAAIMEKKDFISIYTMDYCITTFAKHKDAIFGALSSCSRLTFVSMIGSHIDDEVCDSIRIFLAVSTACTKLVLRENDIGPVGVAKVALGLRKNNSIKVFDISKNPLGDEGVKKLLDAFTSGGNTTVEELSFSECKTSDSIEDSIEMMLADNDSVSRMKYSAAQQRKSIMEKLKKNTQLVKEKFLRDLKGEHKGQWNRSKLMFIGQGRAGKTTTVKRLLGKNFHDKEDSTVGASVSQTQTSTTKFDGWSDVDSNNATFFGQGMKPNAALNAIAVKNVISKNQAQAQKDAEEKKRQAEELAKKQEQELLRRKQLLANRKANVLVFDEAADFEETEEERKKKTDLEENMRIAMELDKRNKENYEKYSKYGEQPFGDQMVEEEVTTRFNDNLFLKSQESKETITFALWDYGGQTVFYSLHHLFLTKFGIYVLCVDMREILGRPHIAEQYLLFWLNSVKLHAPEAPVFLVGTYMDEVKEEAELKAVNEFVTERLKPKFPQMVSFNAEYNFFPVDNKNNVNVKHLRGWIEHVSREQEFVKAQVSLRWLGALDKIMNMKDNEGNAPSWLSLTQVRETAHAVGIQAETELEDMLELFHELGVIVRLTGTEDLRNIITLDPQWLVDGLCRVIRDNKLHMLDPIQVEKAGLTKDMNIMYEKGLASRDLMEFLWSDKKWRGHVDFLLDLMKYMVLISDWNFRDEPLYVIPSLLTPRPEDETDLFANPDPSLKEQNQEKVKVKEAEKDAKKGKEKAESEEELKEKEDTVVTDYAVFDFSKLFLPTGVFQRLVCLCVSYSTLIGIDTKYLNSGKKATEPKLFKNWAEIWMGSDTLMYLQQRGDEIWLSVQHSETAPMCLKAVKSMLTKLNADLMGSGLKWTTKFTQVKRIVKQKKGEKAIMTEVTEKEVQQPEAKKKGLKPWYENVREHKQGIKEDMLNLGGFVDDFMA